MPSQPITAILRLVRSDTRIVGHIVSVSPGYKNIEMQIPSATASLYNNSTQAELQIPTDTSQYLADVEIERTSDRTVRLRLLMPPQRVESVRQPRTEIRLKMMYRPVHYSGVLDSWHGAETLDLSRSGICMETPHAIYPGECVEVRLALASPQKKAPRKVEKTPSLQIFSRVVYCRTSSDGLWKIGLSHTELSPTDEENLGVFLDSVS